MGVEGTKGINNNGVSVVAEEESTESRLGLSSTPAGISPEEQKYNENYLANFRKICPSNLHYGQQPPTISVAMPALNVDQHMFAVATYRKDVQSLITFAVGPCVVLTIFDPSTKTGVLAHFDTSALVGDSLELIFQALAKRGVLQANLQVSLYGGNIFSGSCALALKILNGLKEKGVFPQQVIVGERCFGYSRDFGLNLSDGTVGKFGGCGQSDKPIEFTPRTEPTDAWKLSNTATALVEAK